MKKTYLVGEVWSLKLYPVRGHEQDGLRPCLIVSPNSMNKALETVIVAPLTRSLKDWPTRVNIELNKEQGQVCLEHLRSVSKERFVKKIGKTTELELILVQKHLRAMFES